MKNYLSIVVVLLASVFFSCNSDDGKTQEEKILVARSGDYKFEFEGIDDGIDYVELLKDNPESTVDFLHETMLDIVTNGKNSDAELRYVKCKTTKSSEGVTTNTTVYDFGFAWCLTKKTYTTYYYPCPGMIHDPCQGILAPGVEGTAFFSLGCNC